LKSIVNDPAGRTKDTPGNSQRRAKPFHGPPKDTLRAPEDFPSYPKARHEGPETRASVSESNEMRSAASAVRLLNILNNPMPTQAS